MSNHCLFCNIDPLNSELSDEHVIPSVLGGWITVPFVCKIHNERFGHDIEKDFKKNGYIATALDKTGIQKPRNAYRASDIRVKIEGESETKGYFDKKGAVKTYPQTDSENDYMVVPEDEAMEVIRKKIERFEEKTGKKIDFDVNQYPDLPYDIAIPIYGTDFFFIKRRNKKTHVSLYALTEPIPFRAVAKIALLHFAGLDYDFAYKDNFDALKRWILFDGTNHFVMLHTNLNKIQPKLLQFKPFHYIRLTFRDDAIAAIVCLFSVIKFMVFLGNIGSIDDFRSKHYLDKYRIYDLKKRQLIQQVGPIELREIDDTLLRTIILQWSKSSSETEREF